MTTTAQFQTKPDYYRNEQDCKESKHQEDTQTNPRYRDFKQTHFTAGDENQFQQYRFPKSSSKQPSIINLDGNLFQNLELPIWEKNQNISSESTLDTFRYIFNKFKKGIFIKIIDNELKVFLPFSKANFINEWSHNIKADPKYRRYCPPQIRDDNRIDNEQKDLYGFLNYISILEKRNFNPRRINPNTDEWFGNNCIVRFENPLSEGENNVSNVKNMLEELCASREIPDIELFLNRRDFPIITKDSTEAYNHLWNSTTQPLVSHNYDKYTPILSYSITERHADYIYPTWDDWARVKNLDEQIVFLQSCTNYRHDFSTPWEERIPTAIFRGSTTGCGTTIDTNPRLRVADISHKAETDENGIPYLDAGITKWNIRTRKLQYETYLQTIEKDSFPFGLVQFKSPSEQSHYKYIIHIQGHVSAFRLSLELSMGSVILMVDSPYKIWFSHMLKPYEHYVPVNQSMDNLIDQIKWCRENDEQCKQIALNALEFYNTYLGKKGILDYMQKLFVHLKNQMGNQEYFTSPLLTQVKREYRHKKADLERKFPETTKSISDINTTPPMGRCYGLLKGLEFISNMFNINFDQLPIEKELFKSRDHTVVNLKTLANFNFAIKTTNEGSGQKELEYIHEGYIGSKVINNLLKHIPNFAYNFGLYRNNKKVSVITEYIQGETLFDYLSGPNFNIPEFMFILIQICFALKVAQNRCGFVHYDLTPWNIILSRTERPISFDYFISHDKIYRISTRVIPVIIDYGKSHVIHNGYHYGLINMFNSSVSQDIFTLLVKSIDVILSKKIPPYEFNLIFKLCTFLRPFNSSKEIKNYISKVKKYEELIVLNKHELDKDPIDLIYHIMNLGILREQPFQKVEHYNQIMNFGNPRQVFDYILSSNTEEQLDSYINVIKRFKNCTLPQSENIFVEYYTAQSFEKSFNSLLNDMITFSRINRINVENEIQHFQNLFSMIERIYGTKINSFKNERIEFIIETQKCQTLIKAPYTENTFQNKNKIIELISNTNYVDFDLTDYKDIVEMVFAYRGKYELNENHKEFYLVNFRELLNIEPYYMMNNNANVKTLITVSNLTYNLKEKEFDPIY